MLRPEDPKWYVRDTSGITHSLPFRISGSRIHMSQSHILKKKRKKTQGVKLIRVFVVRRLCNTLCLNTAEECDVTNFRVTALR